MRVVSLLPLSLSRPEPGPVFLVLVLGQGWRAVQAQKPSSPFGVRDELADIIPGPRYVSIEDTGAEKDGLVDVEDRDSVWSE